MTDFFLHSPNMIAGFSDAAGSVGRFFGNGGVFMIFLVLLSVLSIAVIIFKARTMKRESIVPTEVAAELQHAEAWAEQRNLHGLADLLQQNPSTLSRIGLYALGTPFADKDEARGSVQAHAKEEISNAESGIALLEVVITVAPLLGLLGTVSGLVGVFADLDMSGDSGEHARIANGIAEALNTTIAGLAVAVPTVFAHSYFTKKLEKMALRMEVLIGHLVNVIYRYQETPQLAPDPTPTPTPVFDEDDDDANLDPEDFIVNQPENGNA
jgi:biopolymer transport protein ExbB